jgi:8-amino-3,8-dideoxy-alpha-D-manno-octulosonate transaminase
MPGFEVFGEEELAAINELFKQNGGIVFAHGFDAMRNGIYKVREYERAFAKKIGINHAQAVSSGSAALKVALDALGIGHGDEVITQAFTFVATVEAINETGATPIIVDIDDTLGMNPAAFEAAITPRTKAVIPVHMMGEPAEMDAILAIARNHNIAVLEDAAQAVGASYKGKNAGTLGDIGAFSTDAGKTLNTGEGGMVVTNREDLFVKARGAHDHGHEYSTTLGRGEEGAIGPGFNYRMTELQGAIGLVQLSKVDFIVERQRANKAALMERLSGLPVKFRRSPDAEGDIGDTIVMYMPDRARTAAFVAAMRDEKLGTKNLPDAVRWHFAKYWDHLFKGHPLYEGRNYPWTASADILECSVALPVMVKMDADRIDFLGEKLNAIGRKIL